MGNVGRVKAVFLEALEVPASERGSLLERRCAGEEGLRAEVEGLLAEHEGAGDFLGTTSALVAAVRSEPCEGPGSVVGRYRLLELIGEGGFGTVFLAEQREPVTRNVALKIIKPGMDTRAVIARFEAERQTLALMDHPNIARVLDAGATATARPYFVMELVSGEPINAYCDRNRLTVPERLSLFVQVCQAVQHAHQKGIIHRDLKPGNILVSTQDGCPHSKVVDFGIAKATDHHPAETALRTEQRAMLGTPEYMSPEQAEGSANIDTRSDVYSLGVLLYELVTGSTPFDGARLRESPYAEIQRIISQEDPETPSARLLRMTDALAGVAAARRTESRRLGTIVRADLDWIVMKCLEKDRSRRYETASALAADVRRHLTGEPVMAAPPSGVYRLRKFVRRHRVGVWAGAAIGAGLLLGMVGLSVGLVRAERARAAVEQERRRANAIAEFVTRALEASDATRGGAQGMLVSDAMLRAAAEINSGAFKDDPATEAALLATIGRVLHNNGRSSEALPLAERSLAIRRRLHAGDHLDVAESLDILGAVRKGLGDPAGAEPLFVEAAEMARRLFEGDNVEVANSLNDLGLCLQDEGKRTEAERLFLEATEMERRLFSGDNPDLAASLDNLGSVQSDLGDLQGAERNTAEALEMVCRLYPGDRWEVANNLNNLGVIYAASNRNKEAEPLLVRAVEMKRRLFKGDQPELATTLDALGSVYVDLGRPSDAEPLLLEALGMRRRLFGEDHTMVASSLHSLGRLLDSQGRSAEAEPPFNEALTIQRRHFPGDHAAVVTSLNDLAHVRAALGNEEEAEPLYVQARDMCKRLYGGRDTAELATALAGLGSVRKSLGRARDAEPLFLEAMRMRERLFPGDNSDVSSSLNDMGYVLMALNRASEAEAYFVRALEMDRRLCPEGSVSTVTALNNLGFSRQSQGRPAEAEVLYREAIDMARRLFHGDHQKLAVGLLNLAEARDALGHAEEAEPLLEEALAMRRRLFPGDHPTIVGTLNNLGLLRVNLNRAEDGEPLLREGVEMVRRLYVEPNPLAGLILHHHAAALLALRRTQDALAPAREAVALYRTHPDWDATERSHADQVLIDVLAARGDPSDIESNLMDLVAFARTLTPPDERQLSGGLGLLGRHLLRQERYADAEAPLRECLAIRERIFPEGHASAWLRYNAMSLLGGALAGRGDDPSATPTERDALFAEAEPLLLDAYRAIRADANTPKPSKGGGPDRTREALERIIRLYESWEKSDPGKGHDAAEWRARLANESQRSLNTEQPLAR
jgi:tetratricopeptide (TPR) repeat protein